MYTVAVVNSVTAKGLFDSGAGGSGMSMDLCRRLAAEGMLDDIIPANREARGASGESLRCYGYLSLNVTIGRIKFKGKF